VHCNKPHSTLIKYCPVKGGAIDRPPVPSVQLRVADTFPRIVTLNKPLWNAPREHAGYLWVLSTRGDFFRISPASDQIRTVENSTTEFGKCPFDVVADRSERTLLVAVGTRRFAALDPALHVPEKSMVVSPSLPGKRGAPVDRSGRPYRDDAFVRLDAGAPAIAHAGRRFAALRRHQRGGDSIMTWARGADWHQDSAATEREGQGTLKEHRLPERAMGGPFVLSGRFCAYSSTRVYWIDDSSGEVEHMNLPAGFTPANPVAPRHPVMVPWGRPAFVVSDAGVYLPGELNGHAAFAFLEWDVSGPQCSVAEQVNEGDSYRKSTNGHLLLIGQRGLRRLERTLVTPSAAHMNVSPLAGPAVISNGSVAACFADSATAGAEVRVYPEGTRLAVPTGGTLLDLFVFPGYLTLTALVGDALEVRSWRLQ